MVGDENPDEAGGQGCEPLAQDLDLRQRDAAVSGERSPAGGVQPEHGQLRVDVERVVVRVDVLAVTVEGPKQAPGHVEERDVVVARYRQHRHAQGLQEIARRLELAAAGALREVAAHRHQVRGRAFQILLQGGHEGGVLAAEMKVRNVGDGPHAAAGGVITRSARGRTR